MRAEQVTPANAAAAAEAGTLDRLDINGVTAGRPGETMRPLAGVVRTVRIFLAAAEPAGLADFKDWRDLEELSLEGDGTGVTDSVLADLGRNPTLRKLHFGFFPETRRHTPAGHARLRAERPDIRLEVEGKDYPALENWPGKFDGSSSVAPWALPKGAPPPAVVPFTAEDAKKHQQAWADYLKEKPEVESKTGMKFRLIPPGEFETNFPLSQDSSDGGPSAGIRITSPYFLGRTEVTVGQFKQFVEATGYQTEVERRLAIPLGQTWKNPGYAVKPDLPVALVSLADGQAFCDWLTKQEPGVTYRLPTEAEWEHAARAGGAGPWVFGNSKEEVAPHAWLSATLPPGPQAAQSVGMKKPNAFGLYDVIGNVWEQCLRSGRERMTTAVDPVAGGRVLRGRGFVEPLPTGVAVWHESEATTVWSHVGFRVLRQTTKERLVIPNPYKLSEKPIMVGKGQPLGPQATVSRPAGRSERLEPSST